MAETKNTFIKSKMNKDLDERLIPQGEYKDAQNVTISRSDGDDVGTFQNILGNTAISNFNNLLQSTSGFYDSITDYELTKLKPIGFLADETTSNIFIFLTDWNDSSSDRLSNFASVSSNHYILLYNSVNNSLNVLVYGAFLNFSKTHEITGINIIEDLLFWTDNRNQPRKINWKTALSNPTYYTNEDHISVAKYYPFEAARFLVQYESELDTGGTASTTWTLEMDVDLLSVGMQVTIKDATPYWGNIGVWIESINSATNEITLNTAISFSGTETLVFTEYGLKDCVSEWLPAYYSTNSNVAGAAANSIQFRNLANYNANSAPMAEAIQVGYKVSGFDDRGRKVFSPGTEYTIQSITSTTSTYVEAVIAPSLPLGYTSNLELKIQAPNPDYNADFPGDKEFLKDKFIRFSYRFKFDDNEYSLIAPFTPHAFIPDNHGYIQVDDERNISETTINQTMRNRVNCVKLRIPNPLNIRNLPQPWRNGTAAEVLKVTDIEILCTFSNETSIRVVDEIAVSDIGNYQYDDFGIIYEYQSRKPIRTLPESEIVRAYDKVPVRAATQEIVGNRVIYGNYVDKHSFPLHLDYNLTSGEKRDVPFSDTKRELPNHSLKQNRTYQLGVILSDRYGRQTDVILSNVDNGLQIGSTLYGGSSYYHPFVDQALVGSGTQASNSWVKDWAGDELQAVFSSGIPSTLNIKNYPGLYTPGSAYSTNPLGFSTYKFAIKQQEQDYYNVYFWNMYHRENSGTFQEISYQTLVKDNINKIPKDLQNVGPNEKEFSSSVELYNRVDTKYAVSELDIYNKINFTPTLSSKISTIYDPSQWAQDPTSSTGTYVPTYLDIDPTVFNKGKTAFMVGINNNNREIGYFSTLPAFQILQRLPAVYETKPTLSNLEIFYETSTTGIITELNNDVASGNLAPANINVVSWELAEEAEPGDEIGTIELLNSFGTPILSAGNTCDILSVSFNGGPNLNPDQAPPYTNNAFLIEQQLAGSPPTPTGRFDIKANKNFYYGVTGGNFFFELNATSGISGDSGTVNFSRSISNVRPYVGGLSILDGFYPDLTGSGQAYRINLPGASCSLCSPPLVSGINGTFFQGTTNTIYGFGGVDNGPFPGPPPTAYEVALGRGIWARNGSRDPNNWYNDLTFNYTAHPIAQQNIDDVNAIFDLSATDGTLNFDETIARQLSQLRSGNFTGQWTYYIDCTVTDGGGLTDQFLAAAYVIYF